MTDGDFFCNEAGFEASSGIAVETTGTEPTTTQLAQWFEEIFGDILEYCNWSAKPSGTNLLRVCQKITIEYCLMKLNGLRNLKRSDTALDAVAGYMVTAELTERQKRRLDRAIANKDGVASTYSTITGAAT